MRKLVFSKQLVLLHVMFFMGSGRGTNPGRVFLVLHFCLFQWFSFSKPFFFPHFILRLSFNLTNSFLLKNSTFLQSIIWSLGHPHCQLTAVNLHDIKSNIAVCCPEGHYISKKTNFKLMGLWFCNLHTVGVSVALYVSKRSHFKFHTLQFRQT